MPNMIDLPQKVVDGTFETKKVPPGTYSVEVKEMAAQAKRVTATYVVRDESEYKGYKIFDSFNLEYDAGQKMFREFLDAAGVPPHSGRFDLDLCLGKTMSVTVKHKEDGQKVYANVTNHLPF